MLPSLCEVSFSRTKISFCLVFCLHSFFPSVTTTYYSCGLCVTEALTLKILIPELWLLSQPRPYCMNTCVIEILRYNLSGKVIFYASEVKTKPLPCSRLLEKTQAPARRY